MSGMALFPRHLDHSENAVKLVIDNREADLGEMHSDLVQSTCVRLCRNQRVGLESLHDLKIGSRRARFAGVGFGAHQDRVITGQYPDGKFDRTLIVRDASLDQSAVGLHDRSVLKLQRQSTVALVVFADDKHAAGIQIDAMDEARSQDSWGGRLSVEVKLKTVGECVAVVIAHRVSDLSGLLIQDDHPWILIQNVDVHRTCLVQLVRRLD